MVQNLEYLNFVDSFNLIKEYKKVHQEFYEDYLNIIESFDEDMSEKAHNNTKLTEDDIYNILCRKKLVEKYVTRAAQKVQEEGFEGDSSLFNYDGDFYKEKIKIKYDVTENHKLLDKITMGRVTVN